MDTNSLTPLIANIAVVFSFVAVILGLIKYSRAVREERLLIFLIVFSFTIDFLMGFTGIPKRISYTLYDFYSMIEAFVFFTFLSWISFSDVQKKLNNTLRLLFLVLWLYLHRESWTTFTYFTKINPLYDGIYQAATTFMAGFGLLLMIERRENITSESIFWLTLAIFFSSCSNFFLSIFAYLPATKNIWWLYNTVNAICYILISIGFIKIKRTLTGKPDMTINIA